MTAQAEAAAVVAAEFPPLLPDRKSRPDWHDLETAQLLGGIAVIHCLDLRIVRDLLFAVTRGNVTVEQTEQTLRIGWRRAGPDSPKVGAAGKAMPIKAAARAPWLVLAWSGSQ